PARVGGGPVPRDRKGRRGLVPRQQVVLTACRHQVYADGRSSAWVGCPELLRLESPARWDAYSMPRARSRAAWERPASPPLPLGEGEGEGRLPPRQRLGRQVGNPLPPALPHRERERRLTAPNLLYSRVGAVPRRPAPGDSPRRDEPEGLM